MNNDEFECLDCKKNKNKKEGYYGRVERKESGRFEFVGIVCNKCIFSKMTKEEIKNLYESLYGKLSQ
jgi:hypothetical protein